MWLVSWRWILLDNAFDLFVIGLAIFLEEVIGISLGGRLRVWIVEQILNPNKDLLDGDRGFPTLFFVQY